jgi:C-terminal processing protease CtpA/Prc
MALDQLCGNLFAGELTLPGTRARMHSGYSADGSSGNLGGGAFTRYGRVINGNRASGAGAARAVFVVDETIPEGLGHILGLQVGGVGAIVFEGDAARMCPELHLFAVAEGIIAFIRAADWVHADGTTGFVPDVELPARQPDEGPERAIAAALALLASDGSSSPARPAASVMAGTPREAAYADEPYPSVERRLLALFRLWNVIRYFFPHVDLCDEPWDDLLRDFIPEMIAARDELEYSLALARACARMQDSHSSMSSRALGAYLGAATLPVSVGYVQGETVVTGMSQPVDGLTVGDVVVAVDGEQADVRRRRIGQYLIASHERGLQLKISGWVLNGEPDTTAEITVLRADGTHAAVSVPRGPRTMGSEGPPPAREVVELLRPDVAYIDLERLLDADVDRAFEAAAAAGTVILDGRGYPKSDAFYRRIGEFAGPRASAAVVFALAELPEPRSPNPELSSFREHMQQFTTPVPDVGDARITRLVILINERAISSAEHVCLLYEALFDVTYIGTPTAGANGNVSFLTLPGGASTSFTAHVIRHGDGRQLQRVGIQPHIYVEPTIDGIRAGRDEVLEAALEFLRD